MRNLICALFIFNGVVTLSQDRTPVLRFNLEHAVDIVDAVFDEEGYSVTLSRDGIIKLWKSSNLVREFVGPPVTKFEITGAFSDFHRLIDFDISRKVLVYISIDEERPGKNELVVLNIETGRQINRIQGDYSQVRLFDEDLIAVKGYRIERMNWKSGRKLWSIKFDHKSQVSMTPNYCLITTDPNHHIDRIIKHDGSVVDTGLIHDGNLVASNAYQDDCLIKEKSLTFLLQISSGEKTGVEEEVRGLFGSSIWGYSDNDSLRIFNVSTGEKCNVSISHEWNWTDFMIHPYSGKLIISSGSVLLEYDYSDKDRLDQSNYESMWGSYFNWIIGIQVDNRRNLCLSLYQVDETRKGQKTMIANYDVKASVLFPKFFVDDLAFAQDIGFQYYMVHSYNSTGQPSLREQVYFLNSAIKDTVIIRDGYSFEMTGDRVVAIQNESRQYIAVGNDMFEHPRIMKYKNSTRPVYQAPGHLVFSMSKKNQFGYITDSKLSVRELGTNELQSFGVHHDAVELIYLDDNYAVTSDFDKVHFRLYKIMRDGIQLKKTIETYSNVFPLLDTTSIIYIDTEGQLRMEDIEGNNGSIVDLGPIESFFPSIAILGGKVLVSSGFALKIIDRKSAKIDGTLYFIKQKDWIFMTPEGMFDASDNSSSVMHYVLGTEIIDFNQLKDRYYEPNLLQKVLGYSDEPIRQSRGLDYIELYPKIEVASVNADGSLPINLINQGGGIGKVKILINGKEVASDARDARSDPDAENVTLDYSIKDHPYLVSGQKNKITVQAYNKEGYLVSRGATIEYIPQEEKTEPPKLFGIVVGSSNYRGEQMDLKFAAKDATDFSNALELVGKRYFEKDRVSIATLTTDNKDFNNWPTKQNIEKVFKKFSTTAGPQDVLVVYMSGHGTNYGGAEGDFYYLTSDANNADLNDPAIRKNVAISSAEWTEYIKWVPALKQVMVIDACHSGQLADDIMASRADRSSAEIRALERMKDRTGMYILAGSAADAVSYETSVYGQGLLTYSLLQGIKGAALREEKFVDVMELFEHAASTVPQLANNIGGIQKPEVRVPYGGGSFDIGLVDEQIKEQIILPSPKPIFLRSQFQNEDTFNDDLNLSEKLDNELRDISARGGQEQQLIFVDARRYADAYSLKGRYIKTGDKYSITVRLFKGDKALKSFEIEEPKEKIVGRVREIALSALK